MQPTLLAFVDGVERGRLEPPAQLEERAWLLAVAAVQMNVVDRVVRPILRLHVTGASAPQVIDLAAHTRVDIALVNASETPAMFAELNTAGLGGAAARLAIAVDGVPGKAAVLAPDLLEAEPPPRAFGHVFSRWLRDGGHESGYDLTDFQSVPMGVKYERIASGPAGPPLIVSYLISVS